MSYGYARLICNYGPLGPGNSRDLQSPDICPALRGYSGKGRGPQWIIIRCAEEYHCFQKPAF